MKMFSLFLGVVSVVAGLQRNLYAANTRVTNPSAINVEGGGRGLLYSINFDRVLSDELLAGFGFGTVSVNFSGGGDANTTATLIPVYANYYLAQEAGSLFLTVGATLVTNGSALNGLASSVGGLQFGSAPILANFGLGYEYRSDAGYLFRLTGLGIIGGNVVPWGGITFGYSF